LPTDEERLRELCERISAEHDPDKFLLLIRELNILLAVRGKVSEPPQTAESVPAQSPGSPAK
jgi:hypothetical protein